jgi:hypothetical protein
MTLGTATYGFDEFLADLSAMDTNPSDTILSYLSKTDTAKLAKLLSRLHRVRGLDAGALAKSRSLNPKRKCGKRQVEGRLAGVVGRLLERSIRVLLDGCKCITHGGNVRTNTSEIDFMMLMNSLANAVPMLKKAETHALGEAKCYSSGLKSEWVNELVGLMQTHSTTHSILFLASPPKKLRMDHRHLFHSHSLKGSIVVPFGMTQLQAVASGKNFLKVLNEQYVETITGATNLGI